MGERLNEAEITNVTSLHEINEFNLDRAVGRFLNWTPLHAAASRGQQELFQRLLSSCPELADALDSQQRSLLHLASAYGHIEIVKALTVARPEMCLARDRDGANPLHVAAMTGKVEVLDELFEANPHAARARVDRGERETILHLCVKYNQLQFLSMLLEKYFKGEEFVNSKDNAGNTILHLAVAGQRFEIIEHVLRHREIDVNATNASKQTALDILCLGRKKGTKPEGVDKDIQDLLKTYHAERANPADIGGEKKQIIVAAVLLATLAFQAGVAPPGGVWQDDLDGHKSGKAVMASTHPFLYGLFLYSNTSGFISSLCALIFIMTDWPFKPETYTLWTSITKIYTIASISSTYFISIFMVSPQKHDRRPASRFGYNFVHALWVLFSLVLLLTIANTGLKKVVRPWIKEQAARFLFLCSYCADSH